LKSSRPRPLIPRQIVDDHKRERCAVALAELVDELRGALPTITQVTERARIARQTFYRLFENQEDALRYACDLGNRRLATAVASASGSLPWEERLQAAIGALVQAAQREPALVKLCLSYGSIRPDRTGGAFDPVLLDGLASLVGQGRRGRPGQEPGQRTEELVAGAIVSVLADRLRGGEVSSLGGLTAELSALAALLFGGPTR
jgi:AcrR family transcriptional regulator